MFNIIIILCLHYHCVIFMCSQPKYRPFNVKRITALDLYKQIIRDRSLPNLEFFRIRNVTRGIRSVSRTVKQGLTVFGCMKSPRRRIVIARGKWPEIHVLKATPSWAKSNPNQYIIKYNQINRVLFGGFKSCILESNWYSRQCPDANRNPKIPFGIIHKRQII